MKITLGTIRIVNQKRVVNVYGEEGDEKMVLGEVTIDVRDLEVREKIINLLKIMEGK